MFRSQKAVHSHPLFTVEELGLNRHTAAATTVAAFVGRCEAVASYSLQLPTGILLLLSVPEDPHSGALHFFDQRKGLFSLLEFEGERDGELGAEDFERLALHFQRARQAFHARSSTTVKDLGLGPQAATERAVFAFLDGMQAVASRWIQFPAGVLLYVISPRTPEAGDLYVFDRRQGVFYCLEFEEVDGQLTIEDYERLVRQRRLLDLIRRPWRLRNLLRASEPRVSGSFASCAAIG